MFQNGTNRIPLWADTLVLSAIFVFFVVFSWQKWVCPIIDFGREVYVPWRILHGEVLYKDLAFPYGAFPPYWNALLFKIFGASVLTLCVFNLFITGLLTSLIYSLFYKIFNRSTALVIGILFLCLFAFNHHFIVRNMVYIAPYSHSNFYAVFFGFCSIHVLSSYFEQPKLIKMFFLGVFLGLMLLSRLEIFLAILLPIFVVLTSHQLSFQKHKFLSWSCLFLSILVTITLFFLYFLNYLTWQETLANITGFNPHWREVSKIYLYQLISGHSHLSENSYLFIKVFLYYLVFYFSLHSLCKGINGYYSNRRMLGSLLVLVFLGYTAHVIHIIGTNYAYEIFRVNILFICILGTIAFLKVFRRKETVNLKNDLIMAVLYGWAVLMLFKVYLRMQLINYALIYGMPGTFLITGFLAHSLPKYFELKYGRGRLIKGVVICFLLFFCLNISLQSISWLSIKTNRVGQGNDQIRTLPFPLMISMGQGTNEFLKWADRNIGPEETFITFPEGIMLNFLTKRLIAGPHPTFMPVEMAIYGEANMLSSIQKDPPDYVVYVNRNMSAYGNVVPGFNYGKMLTSWFENNYSLVWETGKNFGNPYFGIKVLENNHRLKNQSQEWKR